MPRLGRVVLPNYPHHIVQRGHNKQVVFAEEADFRYYLKTLEEFKDLYGVQVYGFCLTAIFARHMTHNVPRLGIQDGAQLGSISSGYTDFHCLGLSYVLWR